MKTRGARARWAASPEGIAEAERLAAEEKAELDREAAAAAAAALRRDAVRTGDAARLEEYLRAGADPCLAGACECGMSHPSTMGQHHPRLVRWTTELTRLFPAHDDAAKKKSKKKAPSRGVGLPDPLFRRVVMFWLG